MELNQENTISAYWTTYKNLLPETVADSFETDKLIHLRVELPETLRKLSKMNVNNAALLLSVSLSKLFALSGIRENVSCAVGNRFIPLPDCGNLNTGDAAKFVLKHFREHLNHLPLPDFQPCLVNFYQDEPSRSSHINFKLNENLTHSEVSLPANFRDFTELICPEVFNLLACIGTDNNYRVSESIHQAYISLSRKRLPEIVRNIWLEIHPFPLLPEKSYLENGGDSIQAIRLLSRLQREGYASDLSSLLNAPRISDWKIEYKGKNAEELFEKILSYPLSATQKLIWEDWSARNQKHIYHEQFLFKLEKCPATEILKEAYNIIWQKYPQLRVSIQSENKGFIQTVQETEADFRCLSADDIDTVLKEDLNEGFRNQLMRCLFIESKGEKYILWSHHHVLLDGWSVGKLISEFIELIEKDLPKTAASPNYQQILVKKETSRTAVAAADYWEDFFRKRTTLSLPKYSAENGIYSEFSAAIENFDTFKTAAEAAKEIGRAHV